MRIITFLLSLFIALQNLFSQKVLDYEIRGDLIKFNCEGIDYEIHAYSTNIIKINSYPDDINSSDSSYTVIMQPEEIQPNIFTDSEFAYFNTDSLTLRITLDSFGIDFIRHNEVIAGHIKNSFFRSGEINGIYFKLDENEGIYGLGLKAVDINRRKLETILYNQNVFGYEFGEDWLNTNVPLFISSNNYAIFVDNHKLHYYDADLSMPNSIKYNVNSGNLNYFFISGTCYSEIINTYCRMTGYQPLLPRWACGFIMSKVSYGTQENCLKIASAMIQNEYPLDALVFDYSWFGYAENMGNFTWDKSNYPNPEILISGLKNKKIKTILISEPFIAQTSLNYNDAKAKNLFVKDTNGLIPSVKILGADVALLDIFKKDSRDWIWKKYEEKIDEGIEGWWIDLIEPEFHGWNWIHENGISRENHNIFSLVWAQNLFEKYKEFYPDKRPFFMYRAGWAGMQRFGASFLCGDENRSWSGLKAQIPAMLGMQMSGLSMFTTDIGGFAGYDLNSELYVRWFQFGVFSPIMRLHMGGTSQVEPFHHNKSTQDIVRAFIKLRYRLLPYNYTLFWENSQTGLPIARPMNFYDNENLLFRNINDQYYWGESFLAAPVIDTNVRKRDVKLPKGNWINYWTKQPHKGDTTITADASLDIIPVFVKAGSFIPTIPQIYNTEEYIGDTLIIEYYPDTDVPFSEYTIYEDDGVTTDAFQKGRFLLINFIGVASKDSLIIRQKQTGSYPNNPLRREMFYSIYNPYLQNVSVKYNNYDLTSAQTEEEFNLFKEAFYFDKKNNILNIHFQFINNSELQIFRKTNFVVDSQYSPEIKAYPIPGTEFLNLEIRNILDGTYKIIIFDINGRRISDEIELISILNNINFKLDFNKYPELKTNGIYYILIKGNSFENLVKFNISR